MKVKAHVKGDVSESQGTQTPSKSPEVSRETGIRFFSHSPEEEPALLTP